MASLNIARECVASLAMPCWLSELVNGVRPPVPEDTSCRFQPRNDPQEMEERMKNVAEEGKKGAKFWAVRSRAVLGRRSSPPLPPYFLK